MQFEELHYPGGMSFPVSFAGAFRGLDSELNSDQFCNFWVHLFFVLFQCSIIFPGPSLCLKFRRNAFAITVGLCTLKCSLKYSADFILFLWSFISCVVMIVHLNGRWIGLPSICWAFLWCGHCVCLRSLHSSVSSSSSFRRREQELNIIKCIVKRRYYWRFVKFIHS